MYTVTYHLRKSTVNSNCPLYFAVSFSENHIICLCTACTNSYTEKAVCVNYEKEYSSPYVYMG